MSTPVKRCKYLFDLLTSHPASMAAPGVITRYRLDIALAGMILTEQKEYFSEKNLIEMLELWGYKIVPKNLGPLTANLTYFTQKNIFLRKRRNYTFNRELLKMKTRSQS